MSGPTCPYFGKDTRACDVGCVPTTPDHLETISTLCAFTYKDCVTYQRLDRRSTSTSPGQIPNAAITTRSMGSLSLIYWGASLLLLVLAQSGLPLMSVHGLAGLMVVSAMIQIFSGLRTVSTAPVRAVAFTGYGLFWLSMIALEILPRAGVGATPGATSLAPYLLLWSLFGIIVCQDKRMFSWGSRISFGLLSLALLLRTGSLLLDTPGLDRIAMILGGNAGLLAVAYGLLPQADRRESSMTAVRPT